MSIPTGHGYDFDPTHGFGLDALRALRPPEAPAGFDEFWHARHARALHMDPQPRLSDSKSSHPNWRVHDITFCSTGFQIGGWLMLPRAGTVKRGLIVGHGYGGRDQPDFDIPVTDTAVLFPCFRGLSRSSHWPVSSDPQKHVLTGIDSPQNYIIGGCVEDLWVAVTALTALYPQIAGHIGYSGISFSGGIGALATAFDSRIARAHLEVPTFSNMPLWLTLPSVGSANAVQEYRKAHPDVLKTLSFFDSATAATRIAVPMLVAVARFDPAVAPPCQFSVANALPAPSPHEIVILDAGHVDYPGGAEQHAVLLEKERLFFGAS